MTFEEWFDDLEKRFRGKEYNNYIRVREAKVYLETAWKEGYKEGFQRGDYMEGLQEGFKIGFKEAHVNEKKET